MSRTCLHAGLPARRRFGKGRPSFTQAFRQRQACLHAGVSAKAGLPSRRRFGKGRYKKG